MQNCVVTVSPLKAPHLAGRIPLERPAMGNPFSYFLSSSNPDHAAVTIQRVWRGHRWRLFLKPGYYYWRRHSPTDHSGSPWLANLNIPRRLSSVAMTRAIQLPSPDSDTAVIAAKAAAKAATENVGPLLAHLGVCWWLSAKI